MHPYSIASITTADAAAATITSTAATTVAPTASGTATTEGSPRSCLSCSQPITSRDARARYCSRACVIASNQKKLADLRAQGKDPGHGGSAADARRASLARRRAAGELLGRAAHNARKAGLTVGCVPVQPPSHLTVAPLTPEQAGQAYQESGHRYEQATARTLAREGTRCSDSGRTLILAGYGAGLRVENGALIVTEGRTHDPQEPPIHELHRGVHGIARIVCLAPRGSLSFDAIAWCQTQGISLTLLDRDGALLADMATEGSPDAHLRRAQYSLDGDQQAAIARRLIRRKLQGQRDTLERHGELPRARDAALHLGHCLQWFALPELPSWLHDLGTLRTFEGRAAATYFAAWAGHPLQWRKSDARRVPPHWLTIRERGSLLSSTNRHAADPCNALLNYAYAVLEGQCRQALTAEGFDVACGILHADQKGRDSLVYDLMELYRPVVDDRVLSFQGRTTFTYGDLVMTSTGQCRLHPQLARAVVAACRVSHQEVAAGAVELRSLLVDGNALRGERAVDSSEIA